MSTHKPLKIFLIVLAVILLIAVGMVICNRFHSDFTKLNKTDQEILREYDKFCAGETEKPLWKGYKLSDKTVVLMSRDSMAVYLVNPTHSIHNVIAKKISLPDSFTLRAVYRVAPIMPSIWRMKVTGNFNTIGAKYPMFGDDVYYVKYSRTKSLDQKYTSSHFITFLSHEAFHYYMQDKWKSEGNSSVSLSTSDVKLMRQEYDVLKQIQDYLMNGGNDRAKLKDYASQYVLIMELRMAANQDYTLAETSKETAEGTATYVSIKASKIVGYDYGVMYFDNVKNVSFGDVFKQIDAGKVQMDYLYSRMPYETGALLCELLDAMGAPDWQKTLNQQTLKSPETLYTVIKSNVE
jgi:hypothetical protein